MAEYPNPVIGHRYSYKDDNIRRITNIIKREIECDGPDIGSLVLEDRFAKYRSMCWKISKYIDSFKIEYNKEDVEARVGIFSIWLKVVDDEMEKSDKNVGKDILNRLQDPSPRFDEETKGSPSKFLTEILKKQIKPGIYGAVLTGFYALYTSVVDNDNSTNMDDYISSRRKSGELTANIIYQLIEPDLRGNLNKFKKFLMQLGGVGNLVDSCLDIKKDISNGAFKFIPSALDVAKLYTKTSMEGIKMFIEYPTFSFKFFRSIIKNIKYLRQLA